MYLPKNVKMIQKVFIQMKKFNSRHWNLVRYPLLVILLTILILKLSIVEDVEGWEENTSRDVGQYILPNENTTIIYPTQLSPHTFSEYDIVIFVTSNPKNFNQRNAIRQTWGAVNNQDSDLRICVTFLLGLTTNPEVR